MAVYVTLARKREDAARSAPGLFGAKEDRLKRFARRRWPVSIVLFAAAAQLLGACAPSALAQPSTGRANAPASLDGAAGDTGRPRPTVESASRETQAAIKACDDRSAILCVADALTRYAMALQEIAEQRRLQPRPPSQKTP